MQNDRKNQKDQNNKDLGKKGVLPEEHTRATQPDDTSMSSGNLVNNPKGRSATGDLHTKISVTGNDGDGQAD